MAGRPRKLESEKADHRLCVCLRTETVDAIYRYASREGEQAGPILRRVLERVFGMLETSSTRAACYNGERQPSASTMRYVLTGSPPIRAPRPVEAVLSALGRRESSGV